METTIHITKSSQAASLLQSHMSKLDHEELWLVFLTCTNSVIGKSMVSMGSLSQTIIDARSILRQALLHNAASIIMMHNHPSGEPLPSKNDLMYTKTVKEACNIIGISLLDHLILSTNSYYSFADETITIYNI